MKLKSKILNWKKPSDEKEHSGIDYLEQSSFMISSEINYDSIKTIEVFSWFKNTFYDFKIFYLILTISLAGFAKYLDSSMKKI